MKTFLIITLSIVMGFSISSNAFSSDKYEDIYGSKIDQMISFYQARLHLLDSEFKILSDIGHDAFKMIDYLQGRREQLVEEMKAKRFYKAAKSRSYIVNKARTYVTNTEKTAMGLKYSKL